MHGHGDDAVKVEGTRKESILRKLDVPIEHVDYGYVEKCENAKELEKILRVLRSGEEGYYPDLETFVSAKLEKLNPRSRYLRVEVPILRPESLEKDDRVKLETDLLDWLDQLGGKGDDIFTNVDTKEFSNVPVRGTTIISKTDTGSKSSSKSSNPDRIMSWEYDKWDKYDADTELMKLDIPKMKAEEKERTERLRQEKTAPTASAESNETEKSRRIEKSSEPLQKPQKPCCSKSLSKEVLQESWFEPKSKGQQLEPSFIEEVTQDLPAPKPKRRVKIIIDDVHLG